jgi:hypothetical protein
VLDGLKQPEHCGGLTEVAKGFWMRRDAIAMPKLVDYALRLGVGAVVRRLGFLLETFDIDAPAEIERLRAELTATYALLDPLMPAEGPYLAQSDERDHDEHDQAKDAERDRATNKLCKAAGHKDRCGQPLSDSPQLVAACDRLLNRVHRRNAPIHRASDINHGADCHDYQPCQEAVLDRTQQRKSLFRFRRSRAV